MMSNVVIGEGTKVTLHFSVKLDSGEVVDSTFDNQPAIFTVGDGNLLPGFEKALFGMSAGEEAEHAILPEDGFGQHNPGNVQEIPRADFADEIELEPGLMLSFADAQKSELPGVVAEVHDDVVLVDFNHPLAGRIIHFQVKILEVEPAQVH